MTWTAELECVPRRILWGAMATPVHIELPWHSNMALQESTQRPEGRISLAKLAIGDHKELHLQKFVHLHGTKHADIDMETNDYCFPMEVDSDLPSTQDDTFSSQPSDKESRFEADIQLQVILRVHRQVQDDIELKLKTTGNNSNRACYMKYLEVYRKIILKARGQAPVAALATAFVHFGKDQNGLTLPILHNSKAKIRVQPTSISRRKSKLKTSTAQTSGPKPSLNGVKGKKLI